MWAWLVVGAGRLLPSSLLLSLLPSLLIFVVVVGVGAWAVFDVVFVFVMVTVFVFVAVVVAFVVIVVAVYDSIQFQNACLVRSATVSLSQSPGWHDYLDHTTTTRSTTTPTPTTATKTAMTIPTKIKRRRGDNCP